MKITIKNVAAARVQSGRLSGQPSASRHANAEAPDLKRQKRNEMPVMTSDSEPPDESSDDLNSDESSDVLEPLRVLFGDEMVNGAIQRASDKFAAPAAS